jgi:transmembrane sensor
MARIGHARRKTIFSAVFAAAVTALLSPMAPVSAWVHAESPPMQVYSTAPGELRSIALSEHALAQLNTDTGLVVTHSAQLCDAVLDHGEALFELKRDGTQSLRVVAGAFAVLTHESVFAVRVRDARNVDVIVRSGQVTVGTSTVRQRQYARISAGGIVLREVSDADVNRKLQWTHGQLEFSGEPLADAIVEFNRYNARKLVIVDRTIRSITIGGKFSATDVDAFVAALSDLGVNPMSRDAGDANTIRLVASQRREK